MPFVAWLPVPPLKPGYMDELRQALRNLPQWPRQTSEEVRVAIAFALATQVTPWLDDWAECRAHYDDYLVALCQWGTGPLEERLATLEALEHRIAKLEHVQHTRQRPRSRSPERAEAAGSDRRGCGASATRAISYEDIQRAQEAALRARSSSPGPSALDRLQTSFGGFGNSAVWVPRPGMSDSQSQS